MSQAGLQPHVITARAVVVARREPAPPRPQVIVLPDRLPLNDVVAAVVAPASDATTAPVLDAAHTPAPAPLPAHLADQGAPGRSVHVDFSE